MKRILVFCVTWMFIATCFAQADQIKQDVDDKILSNDQRPKLVVGIVVDQMRYDYLTRFYDKFGNGGFKRLVADGYNCKNNQFNYVPTYTAPGHTSIYTGTTPKYHGIIGNGWFDKETKKAVYCAEDNSVQSVGTESAAGQMSPRRLKSTTFADENKLFTQMRGKTIGISLKDRAAILPVGFSADAAYWFHGDLEGNWITSTYYMDDLPKWVKSFNKSDKAKSYLKIWDTRYDINTYIESGSDLNEFEGGFNGKATATFPYDLASLNERNGGFDILKSTPYGNNLTTDFAIAAIQGEDLGSDNITDILTISYSSTDYIGHNFGVNSKEVEDTYIRLDEDIEKLLRYLDQKVGIGEYTLFLTSDHGAIHVPSYLQSVKIASGYIDAPAMNKTFLVFMNKKYGAVNLVENVSNNQIFLNHEKIESLKLDLEDVQEAIVDELIKYEFIDKVYTGKSMVEGAFTEGIEELIQNGYNQKRSGDIIMVYDPAVISYAKTGSTHGSGQNYDTHVPLLFYGKGIMKGSTTEETKVVDIAPTISALLDISFPNANTGKVISKAIEK